MPDVQGRFNKAYNDGVFNEETIGSVELHYHTNGEPDMLEELEIEGYTYIREDMI